MTLSALQIKKVRKYLSSTNVDVEVLGSGSRAKRPLSGKALAQRFKGLLSKKEADLFERNIQESCEQIDD